MNTSAKRLLEKHWDLQVPIDVYKIAKKLRVFDYKRFDPKI